MKNIIRKILFFAVAGMFLSFSGTARKITITVQSGDYERENCVVSANVSLLNLAYSSIIAIMGRESAYTGKAITWDEIMASPLRYGPDKYEFGDLPDYHEGVFPLPGRAL